jgi:hypothetical protein
MRVYYVQKKGMYCQGVFGIFTTPEPAVMLADSLAEKEKDDYHTFYVFEATLDKVSGKTDFFGDMLPLCGGAGYEREALYTSTKNKDKP